MPARVPFSPLLVSVLVCVCVCAHGQLRVHTHIPHSRFPKMKLHHQPCWSPLSYGHPEGLSFTLRRPRKLMAAHTWNACRRANQRTCHWKRTHLRNVSTNVILCKSPTRGGTERTHCLPGPCRCPRQPRVHDGCTSTETWPRCSLFETLFPL